MSLEMAHKVILPPKKNYIPQFLKQRDINSYYVAWSLLKSCHPHVRWLTEARYTDNKVNKIFLIYSEIQSGAVAVIYEEGLPNI
jgi:hypothetical protein